jgi:primosomal replication protein N
VKRNTVSLSGMFSERQTLRHTPAGIPVLEFRIRHASTQIEAGLSRNISLEIDALALGEAAEKLERVPLEGEYRFEGFLAPRGGKSRQTVLHVNHFESSKG